MQTDELIAAVRDQGGFDKTSLATSETVILSWLNARYRELVAESGFVKGVRDLGPTVAGQKEYALPDSIVRVTRLRAGSLRPFAPMALDDLWELHAGHATLESGTDGAYAETWREDGTESVMIYPEPSAEADQPLGADETIEAVCVVLPTALAAGDTGPVVPDDFHEAIVDGAIAMGLLRDDGSAALAAPFEERFQAAIVRLKRRATGRVGKGPVQARVAGYQVR